MGNGGITKIELQAGDSFTIVTRSQVLVCQVLDIRTTGELPECTNECCRHGDKHTPTFKLDPKELLSRGR